MLGRFNPCGYVPVAYLERSTGLKLLIMVTHIQMLMMSQSARQNKTNGATYCLQDKSA